MSCKSLPSPDFRFALYSDGSCTRLPYRPASSDLVMPHRFPVFTTLSNLLYLRLRSKNQSVILLADWNNVKNQTKHLNLHAERQGYWGLDSNYSQLRLTILLDKAQWSYNNLMFWLTTVKSQSSEQHESKICLFTFHSSPRNELIYYPQGVTTVSFNPNQCVSITKSLHNQKKIPNLFLYMKNSKAMLSSDCSVIAQKLPLKSAIEEYLFKITSRHPAAIKALIIIILGVSGFIHLHRVEANLQCTGIPVGFVTPCNQICYEGACMLNHERQACCLQFQ